MPLDDTIAEGPHVWAAAIFKQSFGCGFASMAATMRTPENLELLDSLLEPARADLQTEWMR